MGRLAAGWGHRIWRVRAGFGASCAFVLLTVVQGLGTASAIAPISQEFLSNAAIPLGSIVSLDKNTSDYVSATTVATSGSIIGVVINADSSPISLSSGQANRVEVATTGVVPVLVSDINGSVEVGDQITASPITGVGMKASDNAKVVGIAQGDLASSPNHSNQSYTDKAGKKHDVLLGEVPVVVSVSYYFKQPDKTLIPTAIQNLANALAGKQVNALPILVSGAIFVITMLIVVTLIYTMIHGSIISVGRNPMSQAAIYRNLVQLSALIVVILAVAVIAISIILTRF
jgi:hypothetical protein